MAKQFLFSIPVFLLSVLPCAAVLFEVPDDFATIGEALYYTGQGDTVLVHPGIYRERLIPPGHDFLLVSEFFFTHDSSAIDSTIIDASDFAEEDTASVLTFVNGNSRATIVSGFTLRGGHGLLVSGAYRTGGGVYINASHPTILSNIITENQSQYAVAILALYSHARFAHNRIHANCGMWELIGIGYSSGSNEMTIVEWNDITGNYGCWIPEWPYLGGPTVGVQACGAAIRFNRFHDYYGNAELGVSYGHAWGELLGNSFERLNYAHFEGTQDWGDIVRVWEYGHDVTMRDNIFRDCTTEQSAVTIWREAREDPFVFERNWFENVHNLGDVGGAAISINEPRGTICENVFIQCAGPTGPISMVFVDVGTQGCRAVVERNHFFANRFLYEGPGGAASAIYAYGTGRYLCTVRDNWFEGNQGIAMELEHYDTTRIWDCRENYWGDPSGPYHPTRNPGGRGDTVGDYILFDPWLTAPPTGSSVPTSPFALSPQDWKLEGAFPNPFNDATQIRLISTRPQPFEVTIYNLLGQRVRQLWRGVVPKDRAVSVSWDGRDEYGHAVAT
ncbi:MAG: hypothetical protein V1784_01650, partial [bacterium]